MPDILVLPQPAGTSMPRPAFTIGSSLLAYDLNSFLILSGRASASTMTCTWLDLTCADAQVPTAVRTMPPDGRHYHCPTRLVEHIGILEHFSTFCQDALCIGLQTPAANQIVSPIHRSRFVAVQACAVAGERDEIPQKPLPCGRGSAWRSTTLGFARFACTPTSLISGTVNREGGAGHGH